MAPAYFGSLNSAARHRPYSGVSDTIRFEPLLWDSTMQLIPHAWAPAVREVVADPVLVDPIDTERGDHGAANGAASGPSRWVQLRRLVDITSLLSKEDDPEFLQLLRDPNGSDANLPRLIDRVNEQMRRIDQATLPEPLAKRIKGHLERTRSALQELNHDKSLAERLARVVPPNLLLAPIPFIVPLLGKPRQQQFAAELVALTVKCLVEMIGMIRNATTGQGLVNDRLMARHYANITQAALFMLPTFVAPSKHLNENIGLALGLAAASLFLLFVGFFPRQMRAKYNKVRFGSPEPEVQRHAQQLSESQGELMQDLLRELTNDHSAMVGLRDTFTSGERKAISPYLAKQLRLVLDANGATRELIALLLGVETPDEENAERAEKNIYTGANGALTVTTAGLMLPDMAGFADLLGDAAFTTWLLNENAKDSHVRAGDSLEDVKTFSGLTIVLVAVLSANKVADNFMEKGLPGLLIGSLILTVLNLTLPGPAGLGMAKALQWAGKQLSAMNQSELLTVAKRAGDNLWSLLSAYAPRGPGGPRRIENSTSVAEERRIDEAARGHGPFDAALMA